MNDEKSNQSMNRALDIMVDAIPNDIQQQLNQRRMQALKKKHSLFRPVSWAVAACFTLVLLLPQFNILQEHEPSELIMPPDATLVAEAQPEMFNEDLQMLAQLEFVFWLAEEYEDEAG